MPFQLLPCVVLRMTKNVESPKPAAYPLSALINNLHHPTYPLPCTPVSTTWKNNNFDIQNLDGFSCGRKCYQLACLTCLYKGS